MIERQLREVEETPEDRETLDLIDKVADWDGHGA